MRALAPLLIAFAVLPGAGQVAAQEVAPAKASPASIVSAYVDAYNSRDLDAMMALMHDEVEWLAVEGSTVSVFANGKQDLADQMKGYFASPMVTSSTIDRSLTDGQFVAAREIASWTAKDGTQRSQSALAVYQIEDGLVRRVWYYPASR